MHDSYRRLRIRRSGNAGSQPAKRNQSRRVASVTLIALLLAFAGCSSSSAPQPAAIAVQTAPAKIEKISQIITADAILYPLHEAALSSKFSAPVKKFYVRRGDKVHAGEMLAVLENKDLAATAVANQGAFEQAQANYTTTTTASVPQQVQKAKLDVQVARENLDAQQKLYNSRMMLYKQGALPRKELDAADVTLAQAQSQFQSAQKILADLQAVGKQQALKSAAGQLTTARGNYQGAQAQLGYSMIRSPISGVVTDRPTFAGEVAPAGTSLITVMDISTIIAKAHIPQSQAVQLKTGDSATLKLSGLDTTIPGTVTLVSPALDPNSTTVEIWIQAANPKQLLKPGATAIITIIANTVPNALVIPAVALLQTPNGKDAVMVVGADSLAHEKPVQAGIRQGNSIQITSGLSPGEQVILSQAYGLPENTKVKVESSGTPAQTATKK